MEPEEESIVARTRRTIKSLPDPYGHGFVRNEDPLERTREAWEKSERFRMISGQIANNSFFLAFRNVVGFGIATTAVLLVIDSSILPYTSPLFILAIWLLPALAAFVPPIAGSEATWSAVEAKISLREQGGFGDGKRHTLRAQPGMDRVLEGLRDGRRQNNISAFLATTSLTLLCLSMLITPRSVAWNLLLLTSMTSGIGLSIHSLLTTYYIRLQADTMPLLIHYAPTHHPTQLGSPLGQLLQSHLDPDSQIEWAEWELRFQEAILPGTDPTQARERLLFLLHLNAVHIITEEIVLESLRDFMSPDAIERTLLSDDEFFNWRTLQRAIEHARAWQPGAFRLFERLQNDFLSGAPEILLSPWRMDISLDSTCYDGSGSLFIALNNQTFDATHVRVEVQVPGGEPQSIDHRFELAPCPPPLKAIELTNASEDDVLSWLPRYLERTVVLWINVAWDRAFKGDAQVQVTLRDDAGLVLGSRIVRTNVLPKESRQQIERIRELLRVRRFSELDLPTSPS
jgi:hypothetical protein